mgnify:CR=1 FL=1
MEKEIKVIYGSCKEGTIKTMNKLQTMQKILEILETQDVESIEITYKKREPACTADYKYDLN